MPIKESAIVVCHASRRNLQWVWVWPTFDEELSPGTFYYVKIGIFFLTTGLVYGSVFVHLTVTLQRNLEIPVTEDVAVVISFTGVYYIILTFVYNRASVSRLLEELSNFQNFGKPSEFEKEEKRLSLLSNAIFIFSIVGTTGYSFIKYLKKWECENINREKDLKENCGFIVSVWTPFDIHDSYTYYVVFLCVFLFTHLLLKPSLLITSCALEMARHIILRIKHLNYMIENSFKYENYCICKDRLLFCIQYHNNILDLAKKLDACFSKTMFAHLTITSTVCACLEKQFLEGDKLCAGIHMLGWVVGLFLACFAGQIISNASETIPETIWKSKWYQADVRLRKHIQFFLLRSQKNLYISVGPFGILSYSLFVSVLKMSYSVLCLLNSQ